MKRFSSALLLALAMLVPGAYADETDEVAKAQSAATAWLALTDGGKYAESWDASGTYFKGAMTKPNWERALESARSPLGAFKWRRLKSANFARSLPGAPDGEYVVFQFDAGFTNKKFAVETVTLMREKDGSWRASGYFIR